MSVVDPHLTQDIADKVADDSPGSVEIGFAIPERYNASRILFDNLDAGRAGKTAIYCPRGDATYGMLAEQACRFGNAIRDRGLSHPDRVLMVLDDTAVYPSAFFGALRAACVPVLINTLSTSDLLRYYLEDSGARIAVIEAGLCDRITSETISGTALQMVVVANGPVPENMPVEAVAWDDWIAAASPELDETGTGRDDMAFWMYSSGSTGRPKGIVHLHHDMAYTHESYGRRTLDIREDDICFSPPKIFFAYGLGNSITFPFSVGASAVLNPGRPEPDSVFDCIESFRPTLLFGLPTLYTALVAHDRSSTVDLSSLRLCLSAAEVLSSDVFESWKRCSGLEIVEGLGSTELLHIYLSNTVDAKRPGASGMRVPGYELRLLGDDGEPVEPGETGVLWVRGHSSAPCYWAKPDKTEETMRGDWIYTGDRFLVDEDGFHYFQGRADDLIKVSGQWVYPLEIERCLAEHESVHECAVLGVELPDRRMTTHAFVVLDKGVSWTEQTTGQLQGFVKERLLPYKYPRIVTYLDALPKTGTDKIDRQALKAKAQSVLARAAD